MMFDEINAIRYDTKPTHTPSMQEQETFFINPLNVKLNRTCHLPALLGAHHILHISKIKVNTGKLCTEEYNNCSCRTIRKQCTVCHFVRTVTVQPKQQCNGSYKISGCELSRAKAHVYEVKKRHTHSARIGRERKTVFK
jgi:hypothetical protein